MLYKLKSKAFFTVIQVKERLKIKDKKAIINQVHGIFIDISITFFSTSLLHIIEKKKIKIIIIINYSFAQIDTVKSDKVILILIIRGDRFPQNDQVKQAHDFNLLKCFSPYCFNVIVYITISFWGNCFPEFLSKVNF